MQINKIEILNYKSCEKTKVDISQNLTALIGINGSGKTSILSAIKMLKIITNERNYYRFHNYSELPNLYETVIIAEIQHDDHVVNLKATFYYDIGSETEEEIAFIETQWKISSLNVNKYIEIPIDLLNENSYANFENAIRKGRVVGNKKLEKFINTKDKLSKEFFDTVFLVADYISKINYFSATQFSNPLKTPTSIEWEERDKANYYRPNRRNGSHTSFISDLYRLKKEESDKFDRYINLVGPNGISLLNGITFEEVELSTEEVNVKSGGKLVSQKRKKLIIIPKISLGKKVLSFNQLSEGTFKTIALLFYLLQNDSSLLLIEEPEVCVHHGLLNGIIEIIKSQSKERQIMISTHSDFVLDQLSPENLLIVTKNDENGTKAKPLTKLLSSNSYKALHEYLSSIGNLGEFWKEGGFDE